MSKRDTHFNYCIHKLGFFYNHDFTIIALMIINHNKTLQSIIRIDSLLSL